MKALLMLLLVCSVANAEIPVKAVESTKPTIQQLKQEYENLDPALRCEVIYDPNLIINIGTYSIFQVVTYVGCGGGNHSESYGILTTFSQGKWNVVDISEVGNDFNFSVVRISYANNILRLNGLKWSNTDPHCCPSVPFTYKYVIKNNRLNPIN
jgi:hypothetical protein